MKTLMTTKNSNKSKQLSPCICAKVRYALGVKNILPSNDKKCSQAYWDNVVDDLSKRYGKTSQQTQAAKNKYNSLIQ